MSQNACLKKFKVTNASGLHARPATMIVQSLQNCRSAVFFTYKKKRVDAKSVLNLLMLAIKRNGEVIVEVQGADANQTMSKLEELFSSQFGEE